MTTVILHVIQNVVPSNANRGKNGEPKTARFGLSERMRWSSQSVAREMRRKFSTRFEPDTLATRTARLVQALGRYIPLRDPVELNQAVQGLLSLYFKSPGGKEKDSGDGEKTVKAPREEWETPYLIFLPRARRVNSPRSATIIGTR